MLTVDSLRRAVLEHHPAAWPKESFGLVVSVHDPYTLRALIGTLRQWADQADIPWRQPHHTVSPAGLAKHAPRFPSELDRAKGGILILDEIGSFRKTGLRRLRDRIIDEQIPIIVVGIAASLEDDPERTKGAAKILGIPIIDVDELASSKPVSNPALKRRLLR